VTYCHQKYTCNVTWNCVMYTIACTDTPFYGNFPGVVGLTSDYSRKSVKIAGVVCSDASWHAVIIVKVLKEICQSDNQHNVVLCRLFLSMQAFVKNVSCINCMLSWPSKTFLQRFPSIVHFIFVDRKMNVMISSSLCRDTETNSLKQKVIFAFVFFEIYTCKLIILS